MDLPINMEMALPREVAYPLPTTLPPGMRQVRLRQPQYAAIVQPIPAGSGIDLIIPEIPGAFGDPSTTSIEVTGYFESKFVVPAGRPFYMQSATCNGCIWGSGNSIFQRYQLYLLTSVLSDDIGEWGLTAHLMFLASYDRQQRLALSHVMGFNQYEPTSTMGMSLAGKTKFDGAILAPDDNGTWSNIGTQHWNIGKGNQNDGTSDFLFSISNFSPYDSGTTLAQDATFNESNAYQSGVFTLRQPFQFNLQLPGIIGSGSTQLFPMFIGPYKISLFADDTSQFMWWDLNQFISGSGKEYQPPTDLGDFELSTDSVTVKNSMYITSVFFQCDYIQCDGASFAIVMSQLPIPDTFALRTTAWTSASSLIPAQAQGISDLAIPIRRASLKCCYCLFSPAYDAINSPAGKYEWVNPNLISNTLIHINGKPYPQMGLDPTNRPNECFKNFLLTIGTWNNDGPKSCIDPQNFFVIDQVMTAGDAKLVRYGKWRNYRSTTTRTGVFWTGFNQNSADPYDAKTGCKPGLYANNVTTGTHHAWSPINRLVTFSDTDWITQAGPFPRPMTRHPATHYSIPECLSPFLTEHPIVTYVPEVAATQQTPAIPAHVNTTYPNPYWTLTQMEGTRCPLQGLSSRNPNLRCCSNQFVLAFDFEHLAKVQYLSGVQSLTGSYFLKLVLEKNLSVPYNVTFVNAFDMLVILNAAMKTAFVRI